ncbi:hypothetical protein VNO77_20059 [Canavalia gladiata]|uniref:Uncharacterized protein n=1 Tax=Canavalia gladiata TaxID=3824 RepID=A0AAN9QJ14_CANGL
MRGSHWYSGIVSRLWTRDGFSSVIKLIQLISFQIGHPKQHLVITESSPVARACKKGPVHMKLPQQGVPPMFREQLYDQSPFPNGRMQYVHENNQRQVQAAYFPSITRKHTRFYSQIKRLTHFRIYRPSIGPLLITLDLLQLHRELNA